MTDFSELSSTFPALYDIIYYFTFTRKWYNSADVMGSELLGIDFEMVTGEFRRAGRTSPAVSSSRMAGSGPLAMISIRNTQ